MIQKFIDALITRAQQTPYFHLDGYMERYWLVPYSDRKLDYGCGPLSIKKQLPGRLLQLTGCAERIHHILRSDDDRAFHDHPWWYVTIILRGGYFEVRRVYDESGLYVGDSRTWYGPGSILFRGSKSLHRLELPKGRTCWTLFITGPKQQHWGFFPNPVNKIYYREYLDNHGKGGA
jgi:hypothetical protein